MASPTTGTPAASSSISTSVSTTPGPDSCKNNITCALKSGETLNLIIFVGVALILGAAAALRALYTRRHPEPGTQLRPSSPGPYSAHVATILLRNKPRIFDVYIIHDDDATDDDSVGKENPLVNTWERLMPIAAAYRPIDGTSASAAAVSKAADANASTALRDARLQHSVTGTLPGAGAGSAFAMVVFARERRARRATNVAIVNPNTTPYLRAPGSTTAPGSLGASTSLRSMVASPPPPSDALPDGTRARVVFVVEMPQSPSAKRQRPSKGGGLYQGDEGCQCELELPPLELGVAEVNVDAGVNRALEPEDG